MMVDPLRRAPRLALTAVLGSLLVAGLALLAVGCSESLGAPGIGSSAQTTDALAILPSDADVYGMTNLAAARESSALEAALGDSGLGMVTGRGSADFDEFVRLTGFDPTQDLDRVYVAGREGSEGGAFVAYGRFDRARIEQFVADQEDVDFEVSDVDGLPVYLTTSDDGSRGGFALINDQMVIAGDEATLRQMLTRVGATTFTPDAELQALFDRVAYPDGAWFVARGFGDTMQIPADAPPSAMAARAADGFVVSMSFDQGGIPVRAFLATKPEASTDDVADVVRGGISAARIGLKDQPEALDVLDDVDVDAEADGVAISGFLTPDFLAASPR
ncbi:hypothetical protein [Rubrivirga sp. IMCC45206]|uniref:hypothetical protein n=1 Tax=Rubrivirga sp. IMCC45206 TaxID=3391614 RepID=UPI00398FABDF